MSVAHRDPTPLFHQSFGKFAAPASRILPAASEAAADTVCMRDSRQARLLAGLGRKPRRRGAASSTGTTAGSRCLCYVRRRRNFLSRRGGAFALLANKVTPFSGLFGSRCSSHGSFQVRKYSKLETISIRFLQSNPGAASFPHILNLVEFQDTFYLDMVDAL